MKKWGQGIKDITPLQFTWINLQGTVLVLIGALIGLIVTFNKTWWLFIILCGSTFIAFTSLLQTIQKLIILYEFDRAMKGGTQNEQKQESTS